MTSNDTLNKPTPCSKLLGVIKFKQAPKRQGLTRAHQILHHPLYPWPYKGTEEAMTSITKAVLVALRMTGRLVYCF